ncbi:MAG TPA: hypothetical protein VK618_02420 [Flavitalea sp.]|nr:hypothetical protein [Flavitalea sp.]
MAKYFATYSLLIMITSYNWSHRPSYCFTLHTCTSRGANFTFMLAS